MIGEGLADRYRMTEKLGAGGMGQVFRAFDSVLGRQVAVKVIPPAQLTQEVEKRFAREARLVARLDHPAILPIYDFGRHNDATFFVMPLIQGAHLRDFQREHPLALHDVLDIAISVADALAYSHERGIVHRDVKPENILVSFQDGRRRVWVTDFGIARDLSEPGLTHTGAILGTVSYASPEQLEGGQVDAAETADAAYAALGCDLERVELAHHAATAAWQGRQSDHTREWTERGIEVARRAGVLGTWRELLRLGATVANLGVVRARNLESILQPQVRGSGEPS